MWRDRLANAQWKNIRDFQDFREWCAGNNPHGLLRKTITYDGNGGGIQVPATHTLHRRESWKHINLKRERNIIQWDGPLDRGNVGTSMLFKNAVPAYGLMPKADPAHEDKFGDGGVPWNGTWRNDWMASVHGHMGQAIRCSLWWDDKRDNGTQDWEWLQAMVDSSPKVGSRLNDATFELYYHWNQPFYLDRPLSFDYRYCEIHGKGRDAPTFYYRSGDTDTDIIDLYPGECFFVM